MTGWINELIQLRSPSFGHEQADGDILGGTDVRLGFYSPDDIRMRGVASGSDALFLGIAPADAVVEYLDGVAYDEITDWGCDVDDITPVEYTRHEGTAAPDSPGTERFWVRSASGTAEQTLDWTIESGEWAVVIMNTDASSGISADVRFGALAPSGLDMLAWSSFAVGLVALIGGGWLLYLAFRRWGRNTTSVGDSGEAAGRQETETKSEPVGPAR